MRSIVIDDDVIKSSRISRVLRRVGYTTDSTGDAESALEMIETSCTEGNPYDVIITDMQYPMSRLSGVDVNAGYKLLKEVKASHPESKVIVISSVRQDIPEADGCVWYQEKDTSNWDDELEKMVRNIAQR